MTNKLDQITDLRLKIDKALIEQFDKTALDEQMMGKLEPRTRLTLNRWARAMGIDANDTTKLVNRFNANDDIVPSEPKIEAEFEPVDIKPEVKPTPAASDDKAQALAMISQLLGGDSVSESRVHEIVKSEIADKAIDESFVRQIIEDMTVKRVIVEAPHFDKPKDIGPQHKEFETLLTICAARENVWLTGPAGSGKTTAAARVAKALDLPFYEHGAVSGAHQLFGYMDGNGMYHRTSFREAFEHGGVYLLDEIDGSIPNEIITANGAIAASAGQLISFPDGMIEKHEDCVIIAAANTWGNGRDREYVGRYQADAAFLDRFAMLAWEYDEVLESHYTDNQEWLRFVQKVRQAIKTLEIRHIVSPRATIKGGKLLAANMDMDKVKELLIWRGMNESDRERVLGAI